MQTAFDRAANLRVQSVLSLVDEAVIAKAMISAALRGRDHAVIRLFGCAFDLEKFEAFRTFRDRLLDQPELGIKAVAVRPGFAAFQPVDRYTQLVLWRETPTRLRRLRAGLDDKRDVDVQVMVTKTNPAEPVRIPPSKPRAVC